ncbi:MAG: hypothetical protein WCJ56_06990 [bacterium]
MNAATLNDNLLSILAYGMLLYLAFRWFLNGNPTMPGKKAFKNLFLQEIKSYDSNIEGVSPDEDTLEITAREQTARISLGHLFRYSMSFPIMAGSIITNAVAVLLKTQASFNPALPNNWQNSIMPILTDGAETTPPTTLHQILPELCVTYVLNNEETIRWLTGDEITATGMSEEEIFQLAIKNLERSCNMLEMEAISFQAENDDTVQEKEGEDSLVRFTTRDGFDATRILIPSFFTRFSSRFGDRDLLVAIPARDELLIMAADNLPQARALAERTQQEFERVPYPLYNRLLLVNENGISLWTPEV